MLVGKNMPVYNHHTKNMIPKQNVSLFCNNTSIRHLFFFTPKNSGSFADSVELSITKSKGIKKVKLKTSSVPQYMILNKQRHHI